MPSPVRLLGWLCIAIISVVGSSPAWAGPTQPPDLGVMRATPEDTEELLVFLEPGADAQRFAREHGLKVKHALRSSPNIFVLSADSAKAARQLHDTHRLGGHARAVYLNQRTRYVRMAFVPNDPYFHKNTPSTGWPGQWHLVNEYVSGLDARVQGAWNRDITGSGAIIGIVDDSLEAAHPDLSPNYISADSWDFGQNDGDPSPVYTDDKHGVSTSGVAGARGGNGIGVTGAAPYAGLAGLRVDFVYQTTQMFVDATLYHSSGTNTNIKVKNHSYGLTDPYILTSSEVSALSTSTSAGTIHCFAAGNESDDCNTRDLQKSPDSITVAAMGSNGKYSSYTNFGACVTVTAPSSSSGYFGIITTDRTGTGGYNGPDSFPDTDYTAAFGGTSSATPLVAGVMALGKQAQPALNTRFAKHVLALTSDIVDPGDTSQQSGGGWITNAAGYHFNANYGFGLVDADQFTSVAAQYEDVSALTTEDSGTVIVNASVPDNSTTGVSRSFILSSTTTLEEVLVYVKATHTKRGDLEAWLTSPSGTTGRVFSRDSGDTGTSINWTFTSNQFWGENPAGTWTLNVRDVVSLNTGTWNEYRVTARMGRLVGGFGPPAILIQPADRTIASGAAASFHVEVAGALPLSYRWQKDGVDLVDDARVSGSATDTLHINNCDSIDDGQYRCVATNSEGTATSSAATLTVNLPQWQCLANASFEGGFVSGVGQSWIQYNVAGSVNCDSSTDAHGGSFSQQVQSANSSNTGGVYQRVSVVPGEQYTFTAWIKTSSSSVMEGCLGVDPSGGTDWNSVPAECKDSTSSTTWSMQAVTVTATAGQVTVFLHARSTKVNSGGYVYFDDVTPDCSVVMPIISQQPIGQSVCPGDMTMFAVSATGQAPLTYQWQKNGADLSEGGHYAGTSTATLIVSDVDAGDVAAYRCLVANGYGSVTSDEASLSLLASTLVTQQPASQSLCAGGTVHLSVSASGEGVVTYQWQKNGVDLVDDTRVSGTTTASLTIGDSQPEDSGNYRCVATADCGVAASEVAVLSIQPYIGPDIDGDCDVDNSDFGLFDGCLSGPDVPPQPGCENRDFDADSDVDQADFGMLQGCLTGTNKVPDAACVN